MANIDWFKQTAESPLFPNTLWSRPENKFQAGRLLIVGGDSHSFSTPAETYGFTQQAGIGSAEVALPEHSKILVPEAMQESIHFLPSLKHGSFARASLAELLELTTSKDGVLLAGGFGRNSETATLLERFIQEYTGFLAVSGDSLSLLQQQPQQLLDRKDTLLVATIGELQKMTIKSLPEPLAHADTLPQTIDKLSTLSSRHSAALLTMQHGQLLCAVDGYLSATPYNVKLWRMKVAAYGTVWHLQHPQQPFEALTSGMYELIKETS